jgi:hypothetical protein
MRCRTSRPDPRPRHPQRNCKRRPWALDRGDELLIVGGDHARGPCAGPGAPALEAARDPGRPGHTRPLAVEGLEATPPGAAPASAPAILGHEKRNFS